MGLSALFASIEANSPKGGSTGADVSTPVMLTVTDITFKSHKTGSGETMIIRTDCGDVLQNVWLMKDGKATISTNVLSALKWSLLNKAPIAVCQKSNDDGFTTLYVGTTVEQCQAIMDFAESRRGQAQAKAQATKATSSPKGKKAPEAVPEGMPF
jgi:hypothetical protein